MKDRPSLLPMLRALPLLLALVLATAAHAQHATAYPNPLGAGPLTVQHDAEAAEVELYDVLGRRLDPRSDLAAGVYLWRLRLADGTATPAQSLTKLAAGPLDVHLVREARPAARLGAIAEASVADREGCRVAAPAFGGLQHEGLRGSSLAPVGGGLGVSGGPAYAALLTCLQNSGGVSYAFPDGASPFATGTSRFEAGALGAAGTGFLDSVAVNLRSVSGGFADLRFGTDAQSARARMVYVLDFLPDGGVAFLDSAFVAPGTPVTRRIARMWGDEGPLELSGLAFSSLLERPGSAFLDSALVAVAAFRTSDPKGVMIQIEGATLQGDAVAVAIAQVETAIPAVFEKALLQTTDAQFGVEDLSFMAATGGDPSLQAPVAPRPMWLQPADPNGLMTDAGTMEIRCARGRSCSTYGVVAVPSLYSTSGMGTEGLGSGSALAASVQAGGFATRNGRGLVFSPGSQFATEAVFVQKMPSGATTTGAVRVVAGTPGNSSLVVGVQDTGATPTVTGGEVVYLRDGVVRRQFDLTPGTPVNLGLRVELSDAFISIQAGGDPSLAPPGRLVFRYQDALRANSAVEVRLDLGDRTPEGYYTITMEHLTPWSLDFIAASGGGDPTFSAGP